jgi:hypothetical protein|tara:strand:- start:625 stop:843 length:219 start_codon:yes stop_codon:yes gene_type:complete
MGTKLQFNIEDTGISVDGTEVVSSARVVTGMTIPGTQMTGTIAAARLPYTVTTTAPTAVGATSSGHVWYVYS